MTNDQAIDEDFFVSFFSHIFSIDEVVKNVSVTNDPSYSDYESENGSMAFLSEILTLMIWGWGWGDSFTPLFPNKK